MVSCGTGFTSEVSLARCPAHRKRFLFAEGFGAADRDGFCFKLISRGELESRGPAFIVKLKV